MIREEREKQIADEVARLVSDGSAILAAQQYRLHKTGEIKIGNMTPEMEKVLEDVEIRFPLNKSYQKWYSLAFPTVRFLAPDRVSEFESLYKADSRRTVDGANYAISDYLQGLPTGRGGPNHNHHSTFSAKFGIQLDILGSVVPKVGSVLADIHGALSSDLVDDEIDAARELLRGGHLRAAGLVAGVALLGHLRRVAESHGLKAAKKTPTLSDYSEALRIAGVISIPTWHQVQRLAQLRTLCARKGSAEPTKEEVAELIDTTAKLHSVIY